MVVVVVRLARAGISAIDSLRCVSVRCTAVARWRSVRTGNPTGYL